MPRGSPQFATPPITPVVKAVLLTSGVVFVAQFFLAVFAQMSLSPYLGFVPARFLAGWIWQPLTYSFLHTEVFHIVFNLLIFWSIAGELEKMWGWRTFLGFYFVCALGAALAHGAFSLFGFGGGPMQPLLGGSGVVYGCLLAYGILFGERTLFAFMLFPMQARYYVLLLAAIEFFSSASRDGVSHLAHLGGMASGFAFLAAMAAWRRRQKFQAAKDHVAAERKKRLKKANHLRLVNGGEEGDEDPKTWN